MGTFKDIIRLIAVTVVAVIVVIFGMSLLKMKPSLLPHERQLVQFNYEKVGIVGENRNSERNKQPLFRGTGCPEGFP